MARDVDVRQREDWIRPVSEQHRFTRYFEILKQRKWLILIITAAAALTAGLYSLAAADRYQATADLLVTPVPGDDPTLQGLGLIRESSDPTRDVETASRLVTTTQVARRAALKLGSDRSAESLLADVTAVPVAQSNIVAVTAEGSSGVQAANLANTFARAAVDTRTASYHDQLDKAIARLSSRVKELPTTGASAPDSPVSQLARLEAARGGDDPTVRLETPASIPSSPVWPKPKLSLLAGILIGLMIGIGAAFAAELLDPRLRREEQLRENYRLPILARMPKESPREQQGPLRPINLTPRSVEAFRTLRTTLVASHVGESGSKTILVTSPCPGDGKTTTAINLATSFAQAGSTAILIEADLRRPTIARAFKEPQPTRGMASVLVGESSVEDVLVTPSGNGGRLRLLLADQIGESMADHLSLPGAQMLVEQAEQLADYVILDSPPLTAVSDALPLAQRADDILVVVRVGASRLSDLADLAELLQRHSMRPAGFVLTAVEDLSQGYYSSPGHLQPDFESSNASSSPSLRARSSTT